MEESNLKRVDNEIKSSEEKETINYKQIKNKMDDDVDDNKRNIINNKLIIENEERMRKNLVSILSSRINNPESEAMLQQSYKMVKNIINNSQNNIDNSQKKLKKLYSQIDEIEKSEREANRKEYEGVKDKKVDNISKTNEKKADNIEIVDF